MIAKLEFTLPDEEEDLQLAVDALRWKNAVWAIDEWLRDQIKYQNQNQYQPARDLLHEELEQRGLRLWD
jgi:hypothetical protein